MSYAPYYLTLEPLTWRWALGIFQNGIQCLNCCYSYSLHPWPRAPSLLQVVTTIKNRPLKTLGSSFPSDCSLTLEALPNVGAWERSQQQVTDSVPSHFLPILLSLKPCLAHLEQQTCWSTTKGLAFLLLLLNFLWWGCISFMIKFFKQFLNLILT